MSLAKTLSDIPVLEVQTCPAGDWIELYYGRAPIYQGHSVPDHVWLELIGHLGALVVQVEVKENEYGEGEFPGKATA